MKTILWATLTANGNYQRNDENHPPRPEALADFAAHVHDTGCFVVGRTTFEAFAARRPADEPARAPDAGAMGDATIVVVTSRPIPGILVAPSPKEALDLLAARGKQAVLLAGGARLHNAFLAADLVDEVVFDVAPVFEDAGLKLVLPEGSKRAATLIDTRALGGGVVQLRYRLR